MNSQTSDNQADSEQRIQRVLARAQRETSARDLLTFSVANVWVVLLALGAAVFALIHRPPNITGHETFDKSQERR